MNKQRLLQLLFNVFGISFSELQCLPIAVLDPPFQCFDLKHSFHYLRSNESWLWSASAFRLLGQSVTPYYTDKRMMYNVHITNYPDGHPIINSLHKKGKGRVYPLRYRVITTTHPIKTRFHFAPFSSEQRIVGNLIRAPCQFCKTFLFNF